MKKGDISKILIRQRSGGKQERFCFCRFYTFRHIKMGHAHTSVTVLFLRLYLSMTPSSNQPGLISDSTNTHAPSYLCLKYSIHSQANKHAPTCVLFLSFIHMPFISLLQLCLQQADMHTQRHTQTPIRYRM